MSCSKSIEVHSPIEATAEIRRWTLCSDDIALIKFKEKPEPWLEDIILDVIGDTGLIGDVDSLEDRFKNFEEGYTEHFYDWQDGDKDMMAYVSTIYNTNAVFNAGIQEIKSTYVSKDESGAFFDTLIGAWQTGAGGAWFNERVSAVSNVAYSAAKSASTLTATMKSQQSQMEIIRGDIHTLEKQIDGKVETWKGTWPIVNPDGSLIKTAKPYYCWTPGVVCPEAEFTDSTDRDTRAEHTGDTYLHIEKDAATGKDKLIGVYRFGKDSDTDGYNWFILEDDLAAVAYSQALAAGVLADGKINSYYQTYPPTTSQDPSMGEGDLWVDSDDKNKLYRYDGSSWRPVRDTDITASVNRLDEATVNINGRARAKSSLIVNAAGVTSGYVAEADNSTWSTFNVFADKFYISGAPGSRFSQAPFSVDTTTTPANIKFNGVVTFENIVDNGGNTPNWLFAGQAARDINMHTTTISGGKIQTYSLNANRIAVDTLWARGMIASQEQRNNTSGYIPNSDPAGFLINGKRGKGSFNYPNIYGAYIRGGYIYGTTLEGSTIKVRDLVVLTDCGKTTKMTCPMKTTGTGGWGIYPCNSSTGNGLRAASYSGNNITVNGKSSQIAYQGVTGKPYIVDFNGVGLIKCTGGANNYAVSAIEVSSYLGNTRTRTENIMNTGGDPYYPVYKEFYGIKIYAVSAGYDKWIVTPFNSTLKNFKGNGELSFQYRYYRRAYGWSYWRKLPLTGGTLYNS
jgi:hypothetical protein